MARIHAAWVTQTLAMVKPKVVQRSRGMLFLQASLLLPPLERLSLLLPPTALLLLLMMMPVPLVLLLLLLLHLPPSVLQCEQLFQERWYIWVAAWVLHVLGVAGTLGIISVSLVIVELVLHLVELHIHLLQYSINAAFVKLVLSDHFILVALSFAPIIVVAVLLLGFGVFADFTEV